MTFAAKSTYIAAQWQVKRIEWRNDNTGRDISYSVIPLYIAELVYAQIHDTFSDAYNDGETQLYHALNTLDLYMWRAQEQSNAQYDNTIPT